MWGMKKALTETQYKAAIRGLDAGTQTLEMAWGVLVDGKSQAFYAEKFRLTRGAVSQAVRRVWDAHQAQNVPKGFKAVQAILPDHQAFIVARWSAEAKKKLEAGQ